MALRQSALFCFHTFGIMALWQEVMRRRVPILMFHGVWTPGAERDDPPLRPRLPAEDFERYVCVLRKRFRIVSLDQAVDRIRTRREVEPHCAVLTFDDGYANNATVAWPILREQGLTATFFIPVDYVETGRFLWLDRLDHAVRHLREDVREIRIGDIAFSVADKSRAGMETLFWAFKEACLKLGWAGADAAATAVESLAHSTLAEDAGSTDWAGFMTWDQMRTMANEGAGFGSHSLSHALLDGLSDAEMREELAASRKALKVMLGGECRSIAYPVGACSASVLRIAAEVGYESGLTTRDGMARQGDSPLALPRVGVPRRPMTSADLLARSIGMTGFVSKVRGALASAPRRKP